MKTTFIPILFVLMILTTVKTFAPNLPAEYSYQEIQEELNSRFLVDQEKLYKKNLRKFKEALAARESGNDWKQYNPYGYIGKFQFGQAALEITGYGHIKYSDFKKNPSIFPEKDQEKAMDSLLRINLKLLQNYIAQFEGREILDSVKITRTGLLAAAHLSGPENVKRFLDSHGEHNPTDKLGTSLSDYLTTFGAHFH
jgi:hypothetical protein